MNRKRIESTLLHSSLARTNEARMTVLLTGIHELLYYIAEEMGVFDDDDDEEGEENGEENQKEQKPTEGLE